MKRGRGVDLGHRTWPVDVESLLQITSDTIYVRRIVVMRCWSRATTTDPRRGILVCTAAISEAILPGWKVVRGPKDRIPVLSRHAQTEIKTRLPPSSEISLLLVASPVTLTSTAFAHVAVLDPVTF